MKRNNSLFTIARYCYPEINTKKTLFCEYLHENENIFQNILGYCSRAQVLSIHEKTNFEGHTVLTFVQRSMDKNTVLKQLHESKYC